MNEQDFDDIIGHWIWNSYYIWESAPNIKDCKRYYILTPKDVIAIFDKNNKICSIGDVATKSNGYYEDHCLLPISNSVNCSLPRNCFLAVFEDLDYDYLVQKYGKSKIRIGNMLPYGTDLNKNTLNIPFMFNIIKIDESTLQKGDKLSKEDLYKALEYKDDTFTKIIPYHEALAFAKPIMILSPIINKKTKRKYNNIIDLKQKTDYSNEKITIIHYATLLNTFDYFDKLYDKNETKANWECHRNKFNIVWWLIDWLIGDILDNSPKKINLNGPDFIYMYDIKINPTNLLESAGNILLTHNLYLIAIKRRIL